MRARPTLPSQATWGLGARTQWVKRPFAHGHIAATAMLWAGERPTNSPAHMCAGSGRIGPECPPSQHNNAIVIYGGVQYVFHWEIGQENMVTSRRGAIRCVQAAVTITALLAADCMSAMSAPGAGSVPVPPKRPAEVQKAAPRPASFEVWKRGFRRQALGADIDPATFGAAFAMVWMNQRALELDAYQLEFVRPIWEYLGRAVSETRIVNGRQNAAEWDGTLRRIEERYGVDIGIVAAIWGIESAYDQDYGSVSVIEGLATLAYDGRRRVFAEEQLVAALRIIQSGDAALGRMVGSWAGAMGHTQFIQTSFEAHAVDFAGDGRRDVWAEDPSDALALGRELLGPAWLAAGRVFGDRGHAAGRV